MSELIERSSGETAVPDPEQAKHFKELEITPQVQKVLIEKSKKYGVDFFDLDNPAQEPLRHLYFNLPGQILDGSKKIEDIDKEIESAIEKVKQAEKSKEEKNIIH